MQLDTALALALRRRVRNKLSEHVCVAIVSMVQRLRRLILRLPPAICGHLGFVASLIRPSTI